jgi:hypothetical protein
MLRHLKLKISLQMSLFNSIIILIVLEGLFNTDTYSLNNFIGQFSFILLNIIFIVMGIFSFIKKINYMSLSFFFFLLITVFLQ